MTATGRLVAGRLEPLEFEATTEHTSAVPTSAAVTTYWSGCPGAAAAGEPFLDQV